MIHKTLNIIKNGCFMTVLWLIHLVLQTATLRRNITYSSGIEKNELKQLDWVYYHAKTIFRHIKSKISFLRKSSKQKEEQQRAASNTKEGGASSAPIRFAVRSLGWVEIAEEDLTPERSSKAVNKCIVDLSLGRNDINDVVGRWGDVSVQW